MRNNYYRWGSYSEKKIIKILEWEDEEPELDFWDHMNQKEEIMKLFRKNQELIEQNLLKLKL